MRCQLPSYRSTSVDFLQCLILLSTIFCFCILHRLSKGPHIMSSREPVSWTSLPLEILQAILSFSCDSITLRDAVLSTPFFYRAYSAAPKLVLRNVVRNELSEGVIPDAVAVVQASCIPPQDDTLKQAFLERLRRGPPWTPEPLSLIESVKFSSINRSVRYFADDFSSTLVANPITGILDENPAPLTRTERDRIERAFFRYQLYCTLFPDQESRPDPSPQRRLFLDKFAAWENEQLACIYDYLWRKLTIRKNSLP